MTTRADPRFAPMWLPFAAMVRVAGVNFAAITTAPNGFSTFGTAFGHARMEGDRLCAANDANARGAQP